MNDEIRYSIGELAELAGVTPRTIRYYTGEGLLPPPETRGRYALYGEEHLLRLRLIARLKESYLPLEEIKSHTDQLTTAQVRQLLDEQAQSPQPDQSASAADYIAQVLNSWTAPPAQLKASERPSRESPAAEAAGFRPRAQLSAASPEPPGTEAAGTAAPAPARLGFAEPLATPAPAPAQESLLRRLIPQRRSPEAAKAARSEAEPAAAPDNRTLARESWRRVQLAPGVELHVREPAAAKVQERLEALIGFARNLFRD
jgi:DNA-binding transcriptional MerR regulator